MQLTILILNLIVETVSIFSWTIWNSACYYYSTDAVTYSLAQDSCKMIHSHVVEVETIEEYNELVKFMLVGLEYWTGAQIKESNHYYWLYGGGPVLSSLWAPHAPDANFKCARFRADTRELDDQQCTMTYNYICEKKLDEDVLYVCEVSHIQIEDIAVGKTPSLSSIFTMVSATVDGMVETSTSHCLTTNVGQEVWWQLDFEEQVMINNIVITNRADCCEHYLKDLEIRLYTVNPAVYGTDATYTVCGYYKGPASANATTINIKCFYETVGRWLRIIKVSSSETIDSTLTLCKVEVYAVYCSKTNASSTCGIPIIQYAITETTTIGSYPRLETTESETSIDAIGSNYFQPTSLNGSIGESTPLTSDDLTTQDKITHSSTSDKMTIQVNASALSTVDDLTTQVKVTPLPTYDKMTTQVNASALSTVDDLTTHQLSSSLTYDMITTQIRDTTSSLFDELTTRVDATSTSIIVSSKSITATSQESTILEDNVTTALSVMTSVTANCSCPCQRGNFVTEEQILDIIQKIKNELSINKKSTNAYLRSLISVHDNRPSVRGVGGTGVVIMIIFFSLFLISDLFTMVSFLCSYRIHKRQEKHLIVGEI